MYTIEAHFSAFQIPNNTKGETGVVTNSRHYHYASSANGGGPGDYAERSNERILPPNFTNPNVCEPSPVDPINGADTATPGDGQVGLPFGAGRGSGGGFGRGMRRGGFGAPGRTGKRATAQFSLADFMPPGGGCMGSSLVS